MWSFILRAAVMGLMAFAANPAGAAPVLSFSYTGSGQVVSPTSQVVVGGRITNTGDTRFNGGQTLFTFLIPQPAYDQYSWIVGAFPKGPSTFIDLNPGQSIDWTITTLGTWPITGKRGDPVPAGDYFLDVASMKITYAVLDPILGLTNEKYAISAAPSRFTWTVVAPATSVPEPGTVALLAGCLMAMAWMRRRGNVQSRLRSARRSASFGRLS
ncbi:MAG: PEP-CTERM sorting domain-containing protein [Alphaproteobacteria bacterium]|nr:PEP-CTERM sorting domain-containing protein [Alphaproteobacteria bacterium]